MKTEKTYERRSLEAKVRLVNRVNAEWNKMATDCRDFEEFLGKKVLLADGCWSAKAKAAFPLRALSYRYYSRNSLSIVVKDSENVEGELHCIYYERKLYIGHVENGLLESLTDNSYTLRTDYTADEIEDLRVIAQKKVDEARVAESALSPFGFYTR